MKIKDMYENLPFDLSGARTKNRFDFEILYGIELLIDNYHILNDYTIVFDYVCDIELHCNDNDILKFYQLKTNNTGKPNNINFLTKKEKDKDSIIGKMYKISNNDFSSNISVLLVSNAPLINNKFVSKPNEAILLDNIDENVKGKIIQHLKDETHEKEINLENIYYLYRNVGVDDFEATLIGKLNKFYEKEKNCYMNKPTVLFNSIKATAISKAKYEKKCDFDELYYNKGITKKDFEKMIGYHYEKNSEIYENCYKQIIENTKSNSLFQLSCTKSLKNLISGKDQKVLNIVEDICDIINKDMEKGLEISLDEYAKNFKEIHSSIKFPIYLTKSDIYTLVIYSFEKVKENFNYEINSK